MMRNNTNPTDTLKESTSREKVLKKVRNALLEPSDNPFPELDFDSPIYTKMDEARDVQFAIEFTKLGGSFIYCQSPTDMLSKVKTLFDENQWDQVWCNDELLSGLLNHAGVRTVTSMELPSVSVAVTSCECMLARTGSILVSSALPSGRRLPFIADIHIVIAFTSQVVDDTKQAIDFIKHKYSSKLPSMLSIISGTSRSDDIEKIMVPGGYGPKELFVFMADEDNTDI